jgi:hypothetical protein
MPIMSSFSFSELGIAVGSDVGIEDGIRVGSLTVGFCVGIAVGFSAIVKDAVYAEYVIVQYTRIFHSPPQYSEEDAQE